MGKKPVSILRRAAASKQGAPRPPGGSKKRKESGGEHEQPAPQRRRSQPSGGGGGGQHHGSGGGSREPPGLRLTSPVHSQAAYAVRRLLEADASKRGGVSLKSLTLAPHIQAKKATYAVTIEVLKHLPVLQRLLEDTQLLEGGGGGGLTQPAAYVLVCDLLFGEGLRPTGPAERAVIKRKADLQASLQRQLDAAGAAAVGELLPSAGPDAPHPRTARVNALKMGVDEALQWLRRPPPEHAQWVEVGKQAALDGLLPDLLAFPPGTDLHNHPLVDSGALILQSKASCMPAHVLAPQPGWTVVDACAAPGNKTTHVAALMGNKGSIFAFEKDGKRVERLRANAAATGGAIIDARHADFLSIDPEAPEYAEVKAVLLDPSCSGSGTAFSRMDYLLPSAAQRLKGQAAVEHTDERVEALAAFQTQAILHALRFPALQRLVYSTCSVHARENEGVVAHVLPEAAERGFSLAAALPGWHRRGVAGLVAGAEKLVRIDPHADGTDGFFVALFVRSSKGGAADAAPAPAAGSGGGSTEEQQQRQGKKKRKKHS